MSQNNETRNLASLHFKRGVSTIIDNRLLI